MLPVFVPEPPAAPVPIGDDRYRLVNESLRIRVRRAARRVALRAERTSADAYRIRILLLEPGTTDRWLDGRLRLPARWRSLEVVEGPGPDAPTRWLAVRR